MGTIKYFEDVKAWKTARELSRFIYSVTNQKPFSHDYSLVDQIRRSAVSVMSNIAEGFESQTDKTFIRYLGIAKSSSGEIRSQIYTALDQKYITEKEFDSIHDLCIRVSAQLSRFITYLKHSTAKTEG